MGNWKPGRLEGWLTLDQASNLPILHLLLVWLLAFPAVTPFIQATLPRSADGLLHLYRVVALDQAFQQGAFFPRWLPDLAFGYGFPLFVFYAPLAYYLSEGIHLLGFGFVEASNLSCALALFVAASGAYLFVRALLGIQPGILAAVAYVYAPYQLFDALARGSLPAVWAAAFLPWVFWAFDRLRRRRQPRDLILSGVTVALLLLSHNISSLLFFPLLMLYLLLTLVGRSQAEGQPRLGWLRNQWLATGLALMLGLGLAAFFWLPAVVERNFVQIERVITPPDFDYHAHFVSLSDLFSLPAPAETGLLNPDFPLTLGLAQVLIAAMGLIALLWRWLGRWKIQQCDSPLRDDNDAKRENGVSNYSLTLRRIEKFLPLLSFTLFSLAATLFMTLPLSVAIWERLPLIAFVQHPHRLLGVTAWLLALLAGVSVAVAPVRLRLGLTVAGIFLIFISTIPLLYPRYYNPLPASLSLSSMFAYERSIGAIGTTSFGEYLPLWVSQLPRESPLEALYQSQSPIKRLDASYLPAGSTIESARYGFNQAELILDLVQPGQVVFNIFYFPGWQASLNGQSVALAPVTERGLIGLTLPAGRSHLMLSFRETPIRLIADGISLTTLLLVVLIALSQICSKFASPAASPDRNGLPSAQFIALVSLALSLILAKMLYFDRFDTPLKHSFNGVALTTVSHPQQVNFGNRLTMLGYDLAQPSLRPGEAFELTAYWQAPQSGETNYSILAQLVDEVQHLYAGQDNLHPGNLPVSRWEPWGYVADDHTVPVPAGTPPGHYFLVTGPYNPADWSRLPVLAGGQDGWSDVFAIPVTINKAVQPPSLAELEIVWPQDVPLGELRWLGASPERDYINPNDFLRIALFWEASVQPTGNYQIQLRLVDESGRVRLESLSQPSHNRYPTLAWSAGERVRDNHAWWIPAHFPDGRYRLELNLLDETARPLGAWQVVGQMDLTQ